MLLLRGNELLSCLTNKEGKHKVKVTYPIYANIGSTCSNSNYQYGYDGPLPPGTFRLKPTKPGTSSFHGNPPGITGLELEQPGHVDVQNTSTGYTYHRDSLWVHESYGNLVSGFETKGCLAMYHGAHDIVKQAVENHSDCGGTFVSIIDRGEASTKDKALYERQAANHKSIIVPKNTVVTGYWRIHLVYAQ